MKRFFIVIALLGLILGAGSSVYAYPDKGSDCAMCHSSDGGVIDPADEEQPADDVVPEPEDEVVPEDDDTSVPDVQPEDDDTNVPDAQPEDDDADTPSVPGCGQGAEDGTLNVVCSNFPEEVSVAKVMIFPARFLATDSENGSDSERNVKIAPMEGIARCNENGTPVDVVSKDDRNAAVQLSAGRHRVLVRIRKGLVESELGMTSVRINGDTTLNLDYSELKILGDNLKNFFQEAKDRQENEVTPED